MAIFWLRSFRRAGRRSATRRRILVAFGERTQPDRLIAEWIHVERRGIERHLQTRIGTAESVVDEQAEQVTIGSLIDSRESVTNVLRFCQREYPSSDSAWGQW
ncbi:hypothetical protein [Burkholderia cepacia]|uniref:hypothetical protein n=1 Tax=Burkholderia cepacia TaxID=292 RepID=UPI000755471C|nr:hypothetical protein [Burkholderia cepacia]